jgi:hypothetical protein
MAGDRSSAVLIISIFLIFAAISGFLAFYFIRISVPKQTKTSTPTNKEIVLTTSSTTIDLSKYTTTTSNLDNETRKNYNQQFKVYVEPLLAALVVNKEEPNFLTNVKYNTNMLKDDNFKYSFALYMLSKDNVNKDIDGNTISISLDNLNNYYNSLYGELFDYNKLTDFDRNIYPIDKPIIEGNNIITTINDDYKDSSYMDIKAVNIKDNTIECDIVIYNTIEEYNKYSDISTYDYPVDLIYSKLEITYENNKLTKLVFRDK